MRGQCLLDKNTLHLGSTNDVLCKTTRDQQHDMYVAFSLSRGPIKVIDEDVLNEGEQITYCIKSYDCSAERRDNFNNGRGG